MKMLVFDFNQTKVDTNPNFEKELFEIEKEQFEIEKRLFEVQKEIFELDKKN